MQLVQTNYQPQSDDAALRLGNLAEGMEEQERKRLAANLLEKIQDDDTSRQGWLEQNKEWLKMAMQTMEDKNWPWPNASNVKFPLVTISAVQFHARASQALLKGYDLVKTRIPRMNSDPEVRQRAERVSRYMSYQLTTEMKEWSEDMDRLLFILPILGLAYKKTYFSMSKRRNVSELVLPANLIVNYYAQSFDEARKTHVMYLSKNEMISRQREGTYLEIELLPPSPPETDSVQDDVHKTSPPGTANDYPFTVYECHDLLDLDDDGYEEPYTITIDKGSEDILRITPRFSRSNVLRNERGEVARIEPEHHFTRYVFLPDPESPIYGLGLGNLLGPINGAVDTSINQLIDAGTLSNLQGGLLGRGMRVKGGALRIKPGEWHWVPTTGDDIRKNVFPMPVRDPSPVLFQLLQLLIESGQKVGSVTESMQGQMPGQNTPFSTTQRIIEEGLMVFTGIYKRIYRSLGCEYYKLFRLNSYYLTDIQYNNILDDAEGASKEVDFDVQGVDVVPSADPDMVSEMKQLIRSETLLQKIQMGLPINVQEATKRNLQAEGHEDVEQLLVPPPQGPPPEIQMEMEKFQAEMQLKQAQLQSDIAVRRFEPLKDYAQAMHQIASAQETERAQGMEQLKLILDGISRDEENQRKTLEMVAKLEAEKYKVDNAPSTSTETSE